MTYVNKLRIASVHLPSVEGKSAFASAAIAFGAGFQTVAGGVFELQINPENYNRTFEIEYACATEIGAPLDHTQFKGIKPEMLELKFTIDGTGVVPVQQPAIDLVTQMFSAADSGGMVGFVTAKLAQLQTVVYGIEAETHRPPFILVTWGKLVFLGVLKSMTHTFTLFHESGLPLRADVNLKINEFKLPNAVASALSLLSPDLTRKHTVKSSDSLLAVCDDIYESPDYYLEVAKANGLTNFRKLSPGSELLLPPIAQQ